MYTEIKNKGFRLSAYFKKNKKLLGIFCFVFLYLLDKLNSLVLFLLKKKKTLKRGYQEAFIYSSVCQ